MSDKVVPHTTLMDQARIMDELGVTEHAAEAIMQKLPKVIMPGLRKVYVKRADVERLIEESTTGAG